MAHVSRAASLCADHLDEVAAALNTGMARVRRHPALAQALGRMVWDLGHPYRWRTWLRGRLPWVLINLGIAGKGEDCEQVGGQHHW